MKRAIKLIAYYAYIATFIIAGAGALNYGFVEGKHIYTVFGILNILVGAYNAYKAAKTNDIL